MNPDTKLKLKLGGIEAVIVFGLFYLVFFHPFSYPAPSSPTNQLLLPPTGDTETCATISNLTLSSSSSYAISFNCRPSSLSITTFPCFVNCKSASP